MAHNVIAIHGSSMQATRPLWYATYLLHKIVVHFGLLHISFVFCYFDGITNVYIKDRNKNQLLSDIEGTAMPGSPVHEQQKMNIIVRCTEDLEKSIAGLSETLQK